MASRLYILFFENTFAVPLVEAIPVTALAPVLVSVCTVFCVNVSVPEPEVIPVIAPPLDILLTWFPDTVDEPLNETTRPVTAEVPPVQLLNVFPVTVFVGEPPFVLLQPAIVVAPVTVILEKLLLLLLLKQPATSLPLSVNSVTVPPAPVLVNAVTIEFPFTFFIPPALEFVQLLDIKVTLPVVFTLILVKVLLLIEVLKCVLALVIKVIAAVPETVCPKLLKSLLFIVSVEVAVAEPDGILIPFIAPPATPLRSEIVLLLMVLKNVPVGALLNAGT